MLYKLFSNYEVTPLAVGSPDQNNLFILGILLCAILISLKKKTDATRFLDGRQTDQLKGYAVLTVILGHLWTYVVQTMPAFVLGSPIELLLMLSGYGLMMSAMREQGLLLRPFVLARLKRTMFLYWLLTPVFLLLDLAFLGRSYRWSDILFTLCGINFSTAVYHIDYVRWFITFLLIWYMIFFGAMRLFGPRGRIFFLFAWGLIILVTDYYVTHLGLRQVMAFPVGCAIAQYHGKIQSIFRNKTGWFLFLACVTMGYVISSKIWFDFGLMNIPPVPTIAMRVLDHIGDLLFGLAFVVLVAFLGLHGYYSAFLVFCGKISYELFLIHGAFLVRYNPIISHVGFSLPVEFGIFLLFAMLLALSMHNIMKRLQMGRKQYAKGSFGTA